MGEVKLEEAAMAMPMRRVWGEMPRPAAVFRAMGTMRTTRAAVGMMLVAKR